MKKILRVLVFLLGLVVLQVSVPAWAGDDLSGNYAGWGTVHLEAAAGGGYTGTYSETDTKEGLGEISLTLASPNRYTGTWKESEGRHGTLQIYLAPNKRAIQGIGPLTKIAHRGNPAAAFCGRKSNPEPGRGSRPRSAATAIREKGGRYNGWTSLPKT